MTPNVLFVHLPFEDSHMVRRAMEQGEPYTPYLVMPLGILYLSSYLKAHAPVGAVHMLDYEYLLRNLVHYQDLEAFLREEARADVDFEPDIIAVSLNFSLSWPYFELAVPIFRALWPKALIIVGGIHATNTTRYILDHTPVDFVFRGEGEIALADMVRQFAEGRPLRASGLYSRIEAALNPELVLGQPVEDLDTLPFPDWSLVRGEEYVTSAGWQCWILPPSPKRVAPVLTSRGCPHQCTYCSGRTVHGRRVRFRSIASVMEEIRALQQTFGVSLFIPFDDMVTAKRSRLFELLDAFQALAIPGLELQFPNALNVNTTDEAVIDALMACGTRIFNFAVESGSPYVQKHIIRKNCNLDKAKALVDLCRAKGAMTICYFIFGFPHETRELLEETIRYISELDTDWPNHQIAVPLVGTGIHREFVAMGAIQENDPELWANAVIWERPFDTPEMSAQELKRVMLRSRYASTFVFSPNLKHGEYDRAEAIFSTVAKTYADHIFAPYGLYLVHRARGDRDAAEAWFRKIRLIVATHARAWEEFQEYADLFEASISGTDRFRTEPFGNVFALRDQGRHDQALALLDLLMAENPGNLELVRTAGGICAARKDFDAALGWFQKVLDREPFRVDVLLNRADVLRYAGRFDQARETLARIQELRPLYRELSYKQGQVEEAAGRPGPAARRYLREYRRHRAPAMLGHAARVLAAAGKARLAGAVEAARSGPAPAPVPAPRLAAANAPDVLVLHWPRVSFDQARGFLLGPPGSPVLGRGRLPDLPGPDQALALAGMLRDSGAARRAAVLDFSRELAGCVVFDNGLDFLRETLRLAAPFRPGAVALCFEPGAAPELYRPFPRELKLLWPGIRCLAAGTGMAALAPALLADRWLDGVVLDLDADAWRAALKDAGIPAGCGPDRTPAGLLTRHTLNLPLG